MAKVLCMLDREGRMWKNEDMRAVQTELESTKELTTFVIFFFRYCCCCCCVVVVIIVVVVVAAGVVMIV